MFKNMPNPVVVRHVNKLYLVKEKNMINPSVKYSGKINAPDANYPQGSARNITSPGDGTGTPLEEDWVNDFFGLAQSAVNDAGITPSGTPDSVTNPQILNALKKAKEFPNVAFLKTKQGAYDGEVRYLAEYGGTGTGVGAGPVYWDASSTETENDVTIFQVTGIPTGRWIRPTEGKVFSTWASSDDLQQLIDAIGSDVVDLIITNVVTISANTSIPDNITLRFFGNGLISRATYTLTIGGKVFGSRQIFSGTGALTFSEKQVKYSYWFGVIDDDSTDNTTAIQELLNLGGHIVIEGDVIQTGEVNFVSDTYLEIDPSTTVKQRDADIIASEQFGGLEGVIADATLFNIRNVSNVRINGNKSGVIKSTRDNNSQFRFGIKINTGSLGGESTTSLLTQNIKVEDVIIKDFDGDSIYISAARGGEGGNALGISPKDVKINGVVCSNNHRSAMSVTFADGLWIENCIFEGSAGLGALGGGAGLNFEPDSEYGVVRNVHVNNNLARNNFSSGFSVFLVKNNGEQTGQESSITFKNDRSYNNGKNGMRISGPVTTSRKGIITIDGFEAVGNAQQGLRISNFAIQSAIRIKRLTLINNCTETTNSNWDFPAYADGKGTISVSSGSAAVTGVGTTFTRLTVGQTLEWEDDLSNPQSGIIQSITNDTSLTLTANASANATAVNFNMAVDSAKTDIIIYTNTVSSYDSYNGGAGLISGNLHIDDVTIIQDTYDNNVLHIDNYDTVDGAASGSARAALSNIKINGLRIKTPSNKLWDWDSEYVYDVKINDARVWDSTNYEWSEATISKTSDYTVVNGTDQGLVMDNSGATSLVTFTLPGAEGLERRKQRFMFKVEEDDGLRIEASGNDEIYSKDGKYTSLTSYIPGTILSIEKYDVNSWIVNETGNWIGNISLLPDSDYTVLESDNNAVFSDQQWSDQRTVTLPPITDELLGFKVTFIVRDNTYFTQIDPDGTDQIIGLTTGAGDRIKASGQGSTITLVAGTFSGGSIWFVKSMVGAWYDIDGIGNYSRFNGSISVIGDIQLTPGGPRWITGSGTPEGAVSAPVGSLFSRTDGGAGTSLYVKESGSGNTGWIGK